MARLFDFLPKRTIITPVSTDTANAHALGIPDEVLVDPVHAWIGPVIKRGPYGAAQGFRGIKGKQSSGMQLFLETR
jgi:hypothetical protein